LRIPARSSAVACTNTSFPPPSGWMKAKALLHVVKFHCSRNHRGSSFRCSAVLFEAKQSQGSRIVHRCLGGSERAPSKGGRPLWSGQMSMCLVKLDWNTLQVEAHDHRLAGPLHACKARKLEQGTPSSSSARGLSP
jgi:hypothetical protein